MVDNQVDLFFTLTFGNIYESLEYNLMALRYYMKAKQICDKLELTNPDSALAYCNIGSLMIKIREFDWAFRSFLRAKEVREYTIGGDTLDCATIYNNLGVTAFYMQSFYSAHGYMTLSYEIYKKELGYIVYIIRIGYFIKGQ